MRNVNKKESRCIRSKRVTLIVGTQCRFDELVIRVLLHERTLLIASLYFFKENKKVCLKNNAKNNSGGGWQRCQRVVTIVKASQCECRSLLGFPTTIDCTGTRTIATTTLLFSFSTATGKKPHVLLGIRDFMELCCIVLWKHKQVLTVLTSNWI